MTWRSTGVVPASMPSGTLREVMIDGNSIVLARLADAVHAIEGICPHAGGSLVDGELQGSEVVCPVHGATYSVLSGQVVVDPDGVTPPAGGTQPVRSYRVRLHEGVVEVDLD